MNDLRKNLVPNMTEKICRHEWVITGTEVVCENCDKRVTMQEFKDMPGIESEHELSKEILELNEVVCTECGQKALHKSEIVHAFNCSAGFASLAAMTFMDIGKQKQSEPQEPSDKERFVNLVPSTERGLRKRCDYEVLGFYTRGQWDNCVSEKDIKACIQAKFRDYDDAEEYAKKLLTRSPYFFKVLLRV